MTDDSIINLSEETKASLRNYAMMAGFIGILIASMTMVSMALYGDKSVYVIYANYVPIAFITFAR